MEIIWGYQYTDSYPDAREPQGAVTLPGALAAFVAFPWAAQLLVLADRRQKQLTSTLPGVWFRRGPETMTLSTPDVQWFQLHYQAANRQCYATLSLNWNDQAPHPEEAIQQFFEGSMAEWDSWEQELLAAEPRPAVQRYISRSSSPWRALVAPAAALAGLGLLAATAWFDWQLVLGLGVAATIFFGPEVWLRWQYSRVGAGMRVEIDPLHHRLTLHDRHGKAEFDREQVQDCLIVQTSPPSRTATEYQYVCFTLRSRQVHIITHQTGPPLAIAQAMGVHYRREESGFASIAQHHRSAAALRAAEEEYQRYVQEFRGRFAAYGTAQLEEIVSQPTQYARHAVAAATQLLQARKTV